MTRATKSKWVGRETWRERAGNDLILTGIDDRLTRVNVFGLSDSRHSDWG